MKTSLNTLIVDDEPLARTGLSDYLGRVDFLTEVGQARDGMEALKVIERGSVDLLLLDVQMPGLNGVELLQSLSRPPQVIFTTAHPGFAVQGFELDAIDYLLKPIPFPRFLKAALKAKDRMLIGAGPTPLASIAPARMRPRTLSGSAPDHESPTATANPVEDLFIRVDGRVERLLVQDILYAESMQNYCRIHTAHGSYLPLLPLKELLIALPADQFLQTHRSYLVNLKMIDAIDGNQVRIGEKLLPVSRSNREELERRLVGGRLL